MTIDDVIADFATTGSTLPVESMRWALDHWDEAAPRFVALLARAADGEDCGTETENALFYIIHLLAEKRETAAFQPLCRLLQDAELSEEVLGDAMTETLWGVLIALYDGDANALKRLTETTAADEFVRGHALDTFAYLARTGGYDIAEVHAYLEHLRDEMRPRKNCFVWVSWVEAVANLGFADLAGDVERLFRHRALPDRVMDLEDFRNDLAEVLADPDGMAGFRRSHDRYEPFADTIGTFSKWYGFSEQYRQDQAKRAARERQEQLERALDPVPQPYVDPVRRIGRNDPCPCGSGKKYKKCCLT
ncbi:MAG TPA: DUF1186 domain-containing protein [Stellaceae bacterium]|nr:DUF1186 domain-containing protein [Stellaceae bacterium]